MVLKLVLLRARDCAECDRQHATFEQVKRDASGQVEFRDVLLEEGSGAATWYKAKEHPTTVLDRDGHELKRWVGVVNKDDLVAAVRRFQERDPVPKKTEIPSGPASAAAVAPRSAVEPPPSHVQPPGPEPFPGSPGQP